MSCHEDLTLAFLTSDKFGELHGKHLQEGRVKLVLRLLNAQQWMRLRVVQQSGIGKHLDCTVRNCSCDEVLFETLSRKRRATHPSPVSAVKPRLYPAQRGPFCERWFRRALYVLRENAVRRAQCCSPFRSSALQRTRRVRLWHLLCKSLTIQYSVNSRS